MIRIFILKENNNYICLNVDNDVDAQNLLNDGAKELPQEQIKSIFGDYAHMANPENTVVNDDGETVIFNYTPPSLDELKEVKLKELSTKANSFEQNVCKDMVIKSSLGYLIDADRRSQTNMQGQITIMGAYGLENVAYRCADDVTRNLSRGQLQTVYNEALINGQNLYAQKWALEVAINAAQTKEELTLIDIKFEMTDFSGRASDAQS